MGNCSTCCGGQKDGTELGTGSRVSTKHSHTNMIQDESMKKTLALARQNVRLVIKL